MANITDKTVKSKYPPKDTNVTWIDTSVRPYVSRSYINGSWEVVGGGVTDYNDIKNKPTINGVELDGNKTSQQLGVYSKPSTGIPQSDLSSDVQSQLNKHFKGWYTSSSALPSNPIVGDYAYVKGATSSDPAAIYECITDGSWSDSERTVDTNNVQTFASGEEVNEISIDNDFVGGNDKVAGADEVKNLNESKINKVNQDVTYNNIVNTSSVQGYIGSDGIKSSTAVTIYFFPVTPGKTYKIKGRFGASTSYYLYAYYNGDTWLESHDNYNSTEYPGEFPIVEKEVTVPNETITHIAIIYYVPSYSSIATCEEKVVEEIHVEEIIFQNKEEIETLNEDITNINEDITNIEEQINGLYLTDPADVETSLKNSVVWVEGFYLLDLHGNLNPDTSVKTSDYINLPSNVKTINYRGGTSTSNIYKQVAIYNNDNECLETFFQYPAEGGVSFDISNLVGATKMRISEWGTYINNDSWNVSIIQNKQQTNKETYEELVDWIDSLNQWKGKRIIAFGASNTAIGTDTNTAYIQLAAERLKMLSPLMYCGGAPGGLGSRRSSLKYDANDNLIDGGLALTIAECQALNKPTRVSYEYSFELDFDLAVFGTFAGESYDESQVVIDGTTYYGGEELIDLVKLPTTRYNNNPHFTYSNGDTLAQHRDSYIGALIFLLNELWTRKPTCRVLFDNAFLEWNNYAYWERIRIGVRKLCDKLHLPFIDLTESIYFNGFTTGYSSDDANNPNIFLYDGEHASLAGRQRLGNIFTHKLLLVS